MSAGWTRRAADADGEVDAGSERAEGDGLHLTADALGHGFRPQPRRRRRAARRILAADLANRIADAKSARDRAGDLQECVVAGKMPERVIDGLEVIRIDDQQEAAILLAARAVEPGKEAFAVQHFPSCGRGWPFPPGGSGPRLRMGVGELDMSRLEARTLVEHVGTAGKGGGERTPRTSARHCRRPRRPA